jgi:hypothetical protein
MRTRTLHRTLHRSRFVAPVCLAYCWRPMPTRSSVSSKFIVTTLMITLVTAGCTSMRPIRGVNAPTPPSEYLKIGSGDRVAVEMTDGRRGRFSVQSVDSEAIVSHTGERYVRAEILQLRRQQFSHAKTWSLVSSLVFGLLLLWGGIDVAVNGPI